MNKSSVLSGELENSEKPNESILTLYNFDTKYNIKTEEEYLDFKLDDLHHSIDIKEETLSLESQLDGELEAQFICEASFSTKLSLEEHAETHIDETLFSCEICDFKCSRREVLELHLKAHALEKPFTCNFCGMKFAIKFLWSIHLKIHSGEKPFECQVCDFKCAEKENLKLHIRNHTVRCEICYITFTGTEKLKYHYNVVHTGEWPFACKFCDLKFTRRYRLSTHLKIHVGEKPFVCEFCDAEFRQKTKLTVHLRTHTDEKFFVCAICDLKYVNKLRLIRHIKMHSGEKPFVCEICNSKFIRKSDLTYHIRSHVRDESFVCKICNFKCAEKEALKEHLEAHTWQTTFSCQVCDAKFLQRERFAIHLRTHTDEKSYSCDTCGLSFSQKEALIVHIRTHTDAAVRTEVAQENSNDDFLSEDKTSGSEYFPSDCYQSDQTSDEESSISTSIINKDTVSLTTKSKINHLKKISRSNASATSSIDLLHPMKKFDDKEVPDISAVIKHATGKRIRNKIHACYFCQKTVIHFARHLEIKHSTETNVSKLLAMPKYSKIRRDGFASLLRAGDFYHNIEVLSTGNGELILSRRPTEQEAKFNNYIDYGPCPHCLGFMLKKHLWHHVKISCTSKRSSLLDSEVIRSSKLIIAESNAILNVTFGAEFSNDFVVYILSTLRDDEVGNYCKNDNLILKFGAMQFEKYGFTQCELTRQSMRQLSRFTLKLRNIDNSESKGLSDYLLPEKFDIIVEATKSLCVSHKSINMGPEFEIPPLALKIGGNLIKCASMKRGCCLKSGNLKGNETLLRFLSLMDFEWRTRISSTALTTLNNRRRHDPTVDKEEDINFADADKNLNIVFTETEVVQPSSNDDSLSEEKSSGGEYFPSNNYQSDQTNDEEQSISTSINNKEIASSTTISKINHLRKKSRINTEPLESFTSTEFVESSSTSLIKLYQPNKFNDKEAPSILAVTKNEVGKRIRNKIHACYFCQKTIVNFSKHLAIKHSTETNVSKLLAMPKHSKIRRDEFASLLRAGDFYHNIEVLSSGNGALILVRRPTEQEVKCYNYVDYGPCPHCLGFMLKKHLVHHVKTSCTIKRSNLLDSEVVKSSKLIIAESNAILNDTLGAEFSNDFVVHILSKLRDDEVGNYCKNDNLILKFGAMQFENYGSTQCELTRQSMRQLSRFTLKLRNIDNSSQSKSLSDYLLPEKFDIIVEATKLLCASQRSMIMGPEFETPSLALKIGHNLKKCASMKRGSCLKSGNLKGNETLLSFLSLMDLEWPTRISSIALTTLNNRKRNDPNMDKEEANNFDGFPDVEKEKASADEDEDIKQNAEKGLKQQPSKSVDISLHVNAARVPPVAKRRTRLSTIRNNKRSVVRRPWTLQEKEAVLAFFKTNIKNKEVPRKALCTECIGKNDQVLSDRSWTDIKFCVKNHIAKITKIQK